MRNIGKCVGEFGWQDVSGGMIWELLEADVKGMLPSVAWRNVTDEWRKEMHEKLSMMKRITKCAVRSSCAFLKSKAERRMMLKLRGGTAAFQIEMGRWHGLKREERVCKECDRLRMCATGYCSALHRTPSGNLFWKPWTMNGKTMETEQPLSYHMHFIYH